MTSHALLAGRVGRPHGLDGSFYVMQPVPPLLSEGTRLIVGERERTVVRRAGTDQRPIVRIEGCADRAAAQALAGSELLVARATAPLLGDEEWWAEDLEGCVVCDSQRRVGTVTRLLPLPSCEVLEVRRDDGQGDLLVPLVRDAVRSVDVKAGVIEVDLQFLGGA